MKKAFNKVPCKNFLLKLINGGGLGGTVTKWRKDYFMRRGMRPVVREEQSDWIRVKSGVPLGFILAPVMFSVYINGMPGGINSYKSRFADDANLIRRV